MYHETIVTYIIRWYKLDDIYLGKESSAPYHKAAYLGQLCSPFFNNDLLDDITCTAKTFADDTKLFQGISSHEDCLQLQGDLNRLVDWSQKWQMRFNEAKCNVLHLGSTNSCYEYSMRNSPLEAITLEKDWGVTIEWDLNFLHWWDDAPLAIHHYMICHHLEYGNVIRCPKFQCDKMEV